jgi:hypothetical protein
MPWPNLDNSNYFGNRQLVIEELGEISTDLYGLSTCTVTAKCPWNRLDLVPNLFSYHPIFTYMNVERQRVRIKDGFLWITLEYAGVPGNTSPIFELSLGLGSEPIETHVKFGTHIAGSPSSPLNGAIFRDPSTGNITDDDSIGVFDTFAARVSGSVNLYAGIRSFLDFSQATWRMRFYTTARPTDISSLGKIVSPEGPAPGLGGNRNWLYQGLTYEQRGIVYGVCKEWKASGFRGWNSVIYGF